MNLFFKAQHWGQKLFGALARPTVVFYLLPALMVLLIAGTIAQRFVGLYQAHKIFFASFIIWAGPVPLPGAFSLLTLLGLSLLIHFLFFSPWRLSRAGIHLAHLGVLVLLAGGLLTAWTAEEGFVMIPEGAQSNLISDYHQRALIIKKDGQVIADLPFAEIKPGQGLGLGGAPFTITPVARCRDCRIIRREDAATQNNIFPDDTPLQQMARFMALVPQNANKTDETRLYGLTLAISGVGDEQDGAYILFEALPKPLTLNAEGHDYELVFQRRQRFLPFALHLVLFEEQAHPGTTMAASYRSDLEVIDGQARWPVVVEMNKPLRYRGYSFFQSSFTDLGDGQQATVLSVVHNKGWLFPYLGTLLIAAGLLLHLVIRRRA